MRRSAITNNDNDNNQLSTTTTTTSSSSSAITNEINNQQQKRSLEDYGFLTNLKRRRHLSPQNSNIDINNDTDNDTISLPTIKKKTRTKSKNRSILNASNDTNDEHNSANDSQTSRKTSSRHTLSSQHMHEISLPNWERMCPNIDQILSNKHAQSGVFAHEVQLVQQELEALLSMSIVRENILKDLYNPPVHNSDTIRSKIRKHQEAERIYSSKKIPQKPLPPLTNQHHQRHNGSHLLLDRQVAMTPIIGAQIDRVWSDINTFYHKISSNDISMIENLVEFNHQLENKLEKFKSEYNNQVIEQSNIIEQLKEENYDQLVQMSQLNPLVTYYVDKTTIGNFQTNIYEHMGQTSPVYRTPISSPMHGRILGNNFDSKDNGAALRVSPRLHPHEYSNNRTGLFSLPNAKLDDDCEVTSVAIKSKRKSKLISSPSSTVKFQQRLQLVQNYLHDQHPLLNETVKRQLFSDIKSTKKRKTSLSISIPTAVNTNDHCVDVFQSKLTTLISLLHECSTISSCALKRARLQSDNEQTWQKLNIIERDLETLTEKLDVTGGYNNSSNNEKAFQNLAQLLTDWQQDEEEFDRQLEELFIIDQ
ncbi:unnamed protein product [Adineta steineri]|uniref:Uncharacterized protein n=1 Tax=Adineta steineri TaxID=433720 RepID=A0A814Q4B2_9BILA|nr:unnamed protein product [Adineta steineri]